MVILKKAQRRKTVLYKIEVPNVCLGRWSKVELLFLSYATLGEEVLSFREDTLFMFGFVRSGEGAGASQGI